MSPPIRDGLGNDIGAIRLGDGTEISEVRTGAGDVVFSSAIPDTVVSRPNDNNSQNTPTKGGVRINTSQSWPSIGGKISNNMSGATRAQIFRVSDGVLMGETDISSLGDGDTFTVENVDLAANETYNFVLDAEGSSFTQGFLFADDSNFPYTSSDGNLEIVNGAEGDTGTNRATIALTKVGDIGFN